MKKGGQLSPFGPQGQAPIETRGVLPSSLEGEEFPPSKSMKAAPEFGDLGSIAAKIGEDQEGLVFLQEVAKKRSEGPQGIIAPKGEEGIKYVGSLPVKEPDRTEYPGSVCLNKKSTPPPPVL